MMQNSHQVHMMEPIKLLMQDNIHSMTVNELIASAQDNGFNQRQIKQAIIEGLSNICIKEPEYCENFIQLFNSSKKSENARKPEEISALEKYIINVTGLQQKLLQYLDLRDIFSLKIGNKYILYEVSKEYKYENRFIYTRDLYHIKNKYTLKQQFNQIKEMKLDCSLCNHVPKLKNNITIENTYIPIYYDENFDIQLEVLKDLSPTLRKMTIEHFNNYYNYNENEWNQYNKIIVNNKDNLNLEYLEIRGKDNIWKYIDLHEISADVVVYRNVYFRQSLFDFSRLYKTKKQPNHIILHDCRFEYKFDQDEVAEVPDDYNDVMHDVALLQRNKRLFFEGKFKKCSIYNNIYEDIFEFEDWKSYNGDYLYLQYSKCYNIKNLHKLISDISESNKYNKFGIDIENIEIHIIRRNDDIDKPEDMSIREWGETPEEQKQILLEKRDLLQKEEKQKNEWMLDDIIRKLNAISVLNITMSFEGIDKNMIIQFLENLELRCIHEYNVKQVDKKWIINVFKHNDYFELNRKERNDLEKEIVW